MSDKAREVQVSSWGLAALSRFSSLPAYTTETTICEVMFVKPSARFQAQLVAQERDALSSSCQWLLAVIFPTNRLFFSSVSLMSERSALAGCCCLAPLCKAVNAPHWLQDWHHLHPSFHQAKGSASWTLALPFVSTPWVCHELFHFLALVCIVSSARSPRFGHTLVLHFHMSAFVIWGHSQQVMEICETGQVEEKLRAVLFIPSFW